MDTERIIHEIDSSPLNRGLRGVDWVADPRNIAVSEGDDLALFDYIGPGRYEGHFFFKSRGRDAIDRTRQLTRRMFDRYGAKMLVGYVPAQCRHVGLVARLAGWQRVGTKMTEDGPVRVYMIAPEIN